MHSTIHTRERSESLGQMIWRIAMVALLLMGLAIMSILMVNAPGSRAMAATPLMAGAARYLAASAPQSSSFVTSPPARIMSRMQQPKPTADGMGFGWPASGVKSS